MANETSTAKIPGGVYLVGGKYVDANGQDVPEDKLVEAKIIKKPARKPDDEKPAS